MSLKSIGAGDASTGFYSHTIDQSLRFEDGDTAHLDKTYGSSAGGDTKTWTWSSWIKIGNPSAQKMIFSGSTNSSNLMYLQLRGDSQSNRLDITWRQGSSTTRGMSTNRQFRDPSAWMHIVWAVDTTQATASNRIRLYINGVEETSFSTDDRSTISQSSDLIINANSADHSIGTYSYSPSAYFDGYMAEIHFVDGTQLDPTSFGETKAGIWIPKNYTGSHGTTGFHLPFDDSSALGDDESANTNDWTPSGLAATDVVLDSPTNNWATMNPLDGNGPTISEGSLKVFGDTSYSVFEGFKGTFPMSSGKWYWEVYIDVGGFTQTGITPTTNTAVISTTNLSYHTDAMTYESNGNKAIGTGGTGTAPSGRTTSSYGNSYTDGDIIGVALDLDSSTTTLTFYKNNSCEGTAFSSLASAEYVPVHVGIQNNFGIFNFGQDSSFAGNETAQGNTDGNGIGDFYYSPPSGFLALCSANLPDPAIDPAKNEEPADYFNTVLYGGTGSTQSITGVGFQPDWIWFKARNAAIGHVVYDSVRGATKYLQTASSSAEGTGADSQTSFDSDGFSVGADTSTTGVNKSSTNYVAWNWLAGTSVSGSTGGAGTSKSYSGSVNTESGFSIIAYAGNGTSGHDIPHHLGVTPEMIIVKSRNYSYDWFVYHKDISTTNAWPPYIELNETAAKIITAQAFEDPTSTNMGLYSNGAVNRNGGNHIAYLFASKDGYSKVGSYTGNGSSNGTFVYTGFRPAWVMIKQTDNASGWVIYDSVRSPNNQINKFLQANSSATETDSATDNPIDFLSNGMKMRYSNTATNNSAGLVYLAFAEQPFKYSNAR